MEVFHSLILVTPWVVVRVIQMMSNAITLSYLGSVCLPPGLSLFASTNVLQVFLINMVVVSGECLYIESSFTPEALAVT